MTDTDIPPLSKFEDLFINNEVLRRVESYLNRFNPIRVMRMESMEIRHSAILGWLLDPRETHGLGDRFLRDFLSEALRGQTGVEGPTALDIAIADLRDAEIRIEKKNVDILVWIERLNWAFVIENKFHSKQHGNQLSIYRTRIESYFSSGPKKPKLRGLFLTLKEEEPHDKNYVSFRYQDVCEILESIISSTLETSRDDVVLFLNHYLETIKEAAGMSTERAEMERHARDLYRAHKKVLDFIMENGAVTDFTVAMESVFGAGVQSRQVVTLDGGQKLFFNNHNSKQISFLPEGWFNALGESHSIWKGCDKWWAGYPVICFFQLYEDERAPSGSLRLFAEVGPITDSDSRSNLIRCIERVAEEKKLKAVRFQKAASASGRRSSRFLKENAINVDDVHNAESIAKGMKDLLDRFESTFQSVEVALKMFITMSQLGADSTVTGSHVEPSPAALPSAALQT